VWLIFDWFRRRPSHGFQVAEHFSRIISLILPCIAFRQSDSRATPIASIPTSGDGYRACLMNIGLTGLESPGAR
jgi:hypothetical protein